MINQNIIDLFFKWSGEEVETITQLPQSGSYRKYYRIKSKTKKAIAVENSDYKENFAFVEFSKHFRKKNLPVPEIYAENLSKNIYLQQDLGNTTLYDFLKKSNEINNFSEKAIKIYEKVIDNLIKIQTLGHQDFDYSICYPRSEFDKQSIMWDLNYFKYFFLKIAKIPFYEQDLEDDFHTFSNFLLKAEKDFFLFRDFQSRNIMLIDENPYFVDYQGGRRGAVQYDLASLLYDAKAEIPNHIRLQLLDYYYDKFSSIYKISKQKFVTFFHAFSLIRILQALGAYGFRGLIEKKLHFIQSIPLALRNLRYVVENLDKNLNIPQLKTALIHLIEKSEFSNFKTNIDYNFKIEIKSFSYKKGFPKNTSEHGGGFVFDCRSLPNPGRYEKFKKNSGLDRNVIDFFVAEPEVEKFISEVFLIISNVIKKYKERKFNYLSIYFGCTGGQHRSVYCAEKLSSLISEEFNIVPALEHIEKENWEIKI